MSRSQAGSVSSLRFFSLFLFDFLARMRTFGMHRSEH